MKDLLRRGIYKFIYKWLFRIKTCGAVSTITINGIFLCFFDYILCLGGWAKLCHDVWNCYYQLQRTSLLAINIPRGFTNRQSTTI